VVAPADLLAVPVGALLGLSLAAPPGPMNAIIAEESVRGGWMSGFRAGLGAMSADACFFVLALAGLTTLIQAAPRIRGVMLGVGGLLMVYFAWGAVRGAREDFDSTGNTSAGFQKAFVLALTNPFQIAWWLTGGVALLDPGSVQVAGYSLPATHGALTILGFFGGILLWISGFPAALVAAGRRLQGLRVGVAYGSAVVLAWFGIVFLWTSVSLLFLG
jgi:threonine/homoserine/homoserine lactone efflux protein